MISGRLIEHLQKLGAERESVGMRAFRLSASGDCRLKTWKMRWFPEYAEAIEAKAMARFALGHIGHDAARKIVAAAGFEIFGEEEPLHLWFRGKDPNDPSGRVLEVRIPGHPDGKLRGEDGSTGLLEIKTMSGYEWKVFAGVIEPKPGEGRLAERHLDQTHAYMAALGQAGTAVSWCIVLGYCVERDKEAESHETFPFHDERVDFDPLRVEAVMRRWGDIVWRGPAQPPRADFGPVPEKVRGKETGRQILPFECSYCPFREGEQGCWTGKVVWDRAAAEGKYGRARVFYFPTQAVAAANRAGSGNTAKVEQGAVDAILDQDVPLFERPAKS